MAKQFLVFDWNGKMAHFRQFDANSSSLSYSFPPPTVIMGMIAGIIGIQRDEYYDLFAPENLKIGVQIISQPRKIMQSVNYIFAKSPGDLNLSNQTPHTQIPIELVTAKRFPDENLHYRIILKLQEEDIFEQVWHAIQSSRYKFLPYFGSAPFLSWIEWCGEIKSVEQIIDEPVIIDTVAEIESIDLPTLSMEPLNDVMPAFFREHVRRDFKAGRQPGNVTDIIWERNRGKIKAKFKQPVYKIKLKDETITACLL